MDIDHLIESKPVKSSVVVTEIGSSVGQKQDNRVVEFQIDRNSLGYQSFENPFKSASFLQMFIPRVSLLCSRFPIVSEKPKHSIIP
jgi:hypothetical protein